MMENSEFRILEGLLKRDRSIRRFREEKAIETETLEAIVGLTRFCASGRNLQPLKYKVINDEKRRGDVFPLLKWAGYLTDWDGPVEGERPTAYIVQGLDTRITKNCLCDEGIQLQAMTLGAAALGIGGCIIKSFNAPKLKEVLELPDWFEPSYVLALGYPAEEVVIEDLTSPSPDAVKYYRTPDHVHHVPKRPTQDLII